MLEIVGLNAFTDTNPAQRPQAKLIERFALHRHNLEKIRDIELQMVAVCPIDIVLIFHLPKSKAKVAFSRQLKQSQFGLVAGLRFEASADTMSPCVLIKEV
jgi:hypothetical protein